MFGAVVHFFHSSLFYLFRLFSAFIFWKKNEILDVGGRGGGRDGGKGGKRRGEEREVRWVNDREERGGKCCW